MSGQQTPPGWYYAEGDPAGSTRWWDGSQWVGEPQATQATDFGNPPQDFGAPPQNFGAPPQSFGTAPQVGQYGPSGKLATLSPGSRIGGRLLDYIVWLVLFLIGSIPVIGSIVDDIAAAIESGDDVLTTQPSFALAVLSSLIATALIVAYETYGNLRGGTLGKRAINAQVVKADGSPLDLMTSFRRMLPYIGLVLIGLVPVVGGLSTLLFFIVGVAALVMLFADNRNQTLWDKVAGTIVVPKNRY